MWAGWLSYATALLNLGGLNIRCRKAHDDYATLGLLSGFRWMHERFCIVSEKPISLKVIRNGRTYVAHNESGPSHLWRDGFAIWSINGITVDEQIVMRPETQTLQQINEEKNADVKAIRIERFGWPRYLLESKAKCLDECRNDIEGTREALFVTPDGVRRFVATCPTGRVFPMGVPAEVTTCEQARKWLQPKPFNILART